MGLITDCCLRLAESDAQVVTVRLDGKELRSDVGEMGLTIYDMAVDPTNIKSMQLEIVTPAQGEQQGRQGAKAGA